MITRPVYTSVGADTRNLAVLTREDDASRLHVVVGNRGHNNNRNCDLPSIEDPIQGNGRGCSQIPPRVKRPFFDSDLSHSARFGNRFGSVNRPENTRGHQEMCGVRLRVRVRAYTGNPNMNLILVCKEHLDS